MMSSKAPRKMIKSMRGSPPIRKEHMMKKSVRSSPPLRHSASSRPPSGKHMSPEMKRGHLGPSSSKSMQASRLRSIASSPHRSVPRHGIPSPPDSMDRSRSYKRNMYDKRKIPSISPVRHPSPPPIPHDRRASSPFRGERYLNSRPVIHDDRLESTQAKKKIRREPERYPRSPSPTMMRKSNEIPFISDGGPPLRSEITSHPTSVPMMSRGYMQSQSINERVERNYRSHLSPSPVSTNQSKRPHPSMKTTYDSVGGERYKSEVPGAAFTTMGEKQYNPTLNERFSTVEAVRTEPRIRYSREDLEKITIDIRRNLKEPSPTLRQIVNPNEVKLVRRAEEGHRPIFDREEIKQAPRDMREDAYFEKKTTNDKPYNSSHSTSFRDIENYEITRHRFDSHNPQFHSSGNRSLSERWQGSDGRKGDLPLDRDEREYDRVPPKKNYIDVPRNRSKSGDRDFRSYAGIEMPKTRPTYPESHSRLIPSSEPPRPLSLRSKEPHQDVRRRLGPKGSSDRVLSPPPRSESRGGRYPISEKRYSESMSREKHLVRRSPGPEPHKFRPRSRSRGRDDKSPEFSRRPDKYAYKSYPDRRGSSPPSSSFSMHSREYPESYRGRGGSRPFRSSRGFRSRGFRGSPRGGFRGRGSFPGGYKTSISPRGRGAPRRGRYSPHLWEHDLYARLSPERK